MTEDRFFATIDIVYDIVESVSDYLKLETYKSLPSAIKKRKHNIGLLGKDIFR